MNEILITENRLSLPRKMLTDKVHGIQGVLEESLVEVFRRDLPTPACLPIVTKSKHKH